MRTARLPTVCASIATRYQYWLGGGPKVNEFEQVSSIGHQMSLARGPLQCGLMSRGSLYGEVPCPKGLGVPVGEVQSIMGNGHMGAPTCGQTRLKTLPSATSLVGGNNRGIFLQNGTYKKNYSPKRPTLACERNTHAMIVIATEQ